ncbi:hypothetical protein ACAM_0884 [Aeropyrum camini SY1 = JCM 12091]|uniref:Uncharacterized protein n=1 Tax=Aeropyrum camini SY1 = JCM 12091 TaxID=1198449 RepID=U3TEG3_9CREN|nr:hypothetical protein ACAM_0884 [Aeropyrum camini SY1 = JCM 12091]
MEKLARALDVIDSTARKLDEASIDLSGNIASTADSEAKRLEREIGKLLEAALAELEKMLSSAEEELERETKSRVESAKRELRESAERNWGKGVEAFLSELESLLGG